MLECKICHITLNNEDVLKYNNTCPCCHTKNSFCEEYIMDIKRISTDESFVEAMIKLKQENPIEYQLKLNQFKLQQEQHKATEAQQRNDNKPHCPQCKSTNIKSISGLNRGASIAIWGIFSKKINKCFECKNCGYTW